MPDPTQSEREHWHGTWNGYNNHKCRCAECKQAASAYMRERQGAAYHRARRKRLYDGPCKTPGCPRKMSKRDGSEYCYRCFRERKEMKARG